MSRTDFCDRCGDDFRYDDIGGYNPPCACRLNCRSCCEHGTCEREREDLDDFGDFSDDSGITTQLSERRSPNEGQK